MLIYLSAKGEARDTLDQMELMDMQSKGGLRKVWMLLDEAFGEQDEELFDKAEQQYQEFRRTSGMSIMRYLTELKRLPTQYLKQDKGTVLSDRSFAQRMLNRAGLSRKEKHDVFFNAGGEYNSKAIEKVLRRRCAKVHEEDSKRGPAPTSKA